MKQSMLFTKTRKEAPADESSRNASLLIRAGFVHKEMAGVYSFLPLGLRVLNKVNTIIREEMNAIGGEELFLTVLQDPSVWQKSGRWSDEAVDNWFKTALKSGTELGLGFTHEEPLTSLMKEYISSYRDLPRAVYQIQTKFRNELRAKSGLMRGREFLMKDLYSFSRTQEEHDAFYELAKGAYTKIFNRVGIGDRTFVTFASGGTFSRYSHEFQTLTDAGEDTIFVDHEKNIAVNHEVYTDDVLENLKLNKKDLVEEKAVEVGNIFSLGTRFSDAFGLVYRDEKGEQKPVIMGSYGIGPGRVIGTVVEVLADDHGIVWPRAVAPFDVHIVMLGDVRTRVEGLEEKLMHDGIDALVDDRDCSAGEKFADSDLIGIPARIVVSERSKDSDTYEVKIRHTGEVKNLSYEELKDTILNLK